MKKILLMLTLLISGVSFGELKHFLPRTNAYHSIEACKIFFEGDTILDGKTYIKLYTHEFLEEPDFSKATYCGAIREDTLGEKYYYYSHADSQECMVCDFSLEKGDTARIYTVFCPPKFLLTTPMAYIDEKRRYNTPPVTIKNVDSVLIDGSYRKRLTMIVGFGRREDERDPGGFEIAWIEGIGSTTGTLWGGVYFLNVTYDPPYFDPMLYCVHENGIKIYGEDGCYWASYRLSVENMAKETPKFGFYPNPVENILYISSDKHIVYYSILSMAGRAEEILPLNGNEINVSDLSRGMHILRVYDVQKRLIAVRKFVKL